VVLAHGFDGVRDQRLDRYAERFAECGWNAFVFDYRYFGESDGTPRQLVDSRAQLDDYRAAIEYVRRRPEVDGERVALWGTSTSAGHAVKLASEDHSIRAVVTQMPLLSGFAQLLALPPTHTVRLLWAGLKDQVGSWFGREFRIPAAGRPSTLAFVDTPDSLTGLRRITPEGSTWRNSVLARFALYAAFYNPGRADRRLRCRLLVCVADGDAVIAPKPALRLAERGELRRYRYSHFAMYHGCGFERVVNDQIAFLRRSLDGQAP
jgi:acetyl esterase/lipase